MSYTAIEDALQVRMVAHFSELNDERCRKGDADAVVESMFKEGEEYGCYIEYNGGSQLSRKPFKTTVWVWSIAGVFMIQYSDDIESKLRVVVDKFRTVFADDHTLGGTTIRIQIMDLADAYIGQVNDIPFYFIPFLLEAIEPF